MLRTVVIGKIAEDSTSLEATLERGGGFVLVRSFAECPEGYELERELRVNAPDTVFVSIDIGQTVLVVLSVIDQIAPGTPVVAFGAECPPERLVGLMTAGVYQFLPVPAKSEDLAQMAESIQEHLSRNPRRALHLCPMYTFVPAKLGVGASTLATHIAVSIAKDTKARCLLIDADINSGLIGFMLKASGKYSLLNLAELAHGLDSSMWKNMVTRVGDLDVLPSGDLAPGASIDIGALRQLVAFFRTEYDIILADVSGNYEKYSLELIRESTRVFVVSTPEVPALYLTRGRLERLGELNVAARTSLLLNRQGPNGPISKDRVEETLGVSVEEVFPDDYQSIHEALLTGKPLGVKTDFGARCSEFACRLAERPSANGASVAARYATEQS